MTGHLVFDFCLYVVAITITAVIFFGGTSFIWFVIFDSMQSDYQKYMHLHEFHEWKKKKIEDAQL